MSNLLKSLALVALVVSFAGPVYAGICNKSHPNWSPKTKTCPEKPVTLKKREPATSPPKKVVSEEPAPTPATPVLALPEPPRSELVTTSRNTSVVPGRGHYVEGFTVATCRGFVAVPNVAWTTRPAVVESSSYELRAVPAPHPTLKKELP